MGANLAALKRLVDQNPEAFPRPRLLRVHDCAGLRFDLGRHQNPLDANRHRRTPALSARLLAHGITMMLTRCADESMHCAKSQMIGVTHAFASDSVSSGEKKIMSLVGLSPIFPISSELPLLGNCGDCGDCGDGVAGVPVVGSPIKSRFAYHSTLPLGRTMAPFG